MSYLTPKRLFWATDFSTNAAQALPYVRALALHAGSRLRVVHVLTEHLEHLGEAAGKNAVAERIQVAKREAQQRLQEIRFDAVPPERVERDVVLAPTPAEGIVRAADDFAADLLVQSTHGRGLVGQLVFGSVTRSVITRTPRPVLVVKPHERGMLDDDGTLRVRRVLVATGSGEPESEAFELALEIAVEFDAELHLMDMTHPTLAPMFYPEGMITLIEAPASRERMERRIALYQERAREHGVTLRPSGEDLANGDSLARYSRAHDIDVIVVRRDLGRDLPFLHVGGAKKLLHDVQCPLLVC